MRTMSLDSKHQAAVSLCREPVAEEAVLDDFDDFGGCVFLAHAGVEPLPGCGVKRSLSHNTHTASQAETCHSAHSLQLFDGLSSEAREASVQHERNQGDHSVHVGPGSAENTHFQCHILCRATNMWPSVCSPHGQVSPHAHLHEPFERRRLHLPAHDHHHLVGQLDVGFPAQVPTRRAFKNEPKVWKHSNAGTGTNTKA